MIDRPSRNSIVAIAALPLGKQAKRAKSSVYVLLGTASLWHY